MGWFNKKWLRRIHILIQAIRAGEYNIAFETQSLRADERELLDELNGLVEDMRKQMSKNETIYGGFEAMLNKVQVAVLAVDDSGKVLWMNRKAIDDLCGFAIDNMELLKIVDPNLPDLLNSLQPGRHLLVSMNIRGQQSQLKISMVRYIHDGQAVRLFSIENVMMMLQQSEMQTQQKIIKVLTHEIMNSLSPIISLSETLLMDCQENKLLDDESMMALNAIKRRSDGLLTFVDNYRKLLRVSNPCLDWVRVGAVIDVIRSLYPDSNVEFKIEDPDIQLHIDRHQIEQVLINLLNNAIDASCDSCVPVVLETKAIHAKRKFSITVTDHGCGIAPEAIDNIFLPFYTTKESGSGIGLSLSRQIVTMHGGFIDGRSQNGITIFTINLPLVYK